MFCFLLIFTLVYLQLLLFNKIAQPDTSVCESLSSVSKVDHVRHDHMIITVIRLCVKMRKEIIISNRSRKSAISQILKVYIVCHKAH